MKKALVFKFSLLFLAAACLSQSYAQVSLQWGLPEGAKLRIGQGRIHEIAYTPDGTGLAVASGIGIWLYDTETHKEADLLAGNTSIDSIAFSPDGTTIAGGTWDTGIRLWDAATGKHLETLYGSDAVVAEIIAFSPDGEIIATSDFSREIQLWDAVSGRHLRTLTGYGSWLNDFAFSPNGRTIAGAGADRTIGLWDVKSAEHLNTLEGHTGYVYSVAFSPDGNILASGSRDGFRPAMGRRHGTTPAHTFCIGFGQYSCVSVLTGTSLPVRMGKISDCGTPQREKSCELSTDRDGTMSLHSVPTDARSPARVRERPSECGMSNRVNNLTPSPGITL